jgi:hypothetical protein
MDEVPKELIVCPRCGRPRTLVDLREEYKDSGVDYPAELPRYVIECCGRELSIENEDLCRRVVNARLELKEDRPKQ